MSDLFTSEPHEDGEWISVSDLMAGLMLIFLFIAIVYIRVQVAEKERAITEKEIAMAQSRELERIKSQIAEIVVAWERSSEAIYEALYAEFEDDLDRWGASIRRRTLTIRFDAPRVLFDVNAATLKPEFEEILSEFFPRYLAVLHDHREVIEEVRIEGHTSSEWMEGMTSEEAFFENMDLSQARTREVLEYAMSLDETTSYRDWAMRKVTANGMSSSRLILTADGDEDRAASRRVEFRVRTRTEEQVMRVLEKVR